MAAFKCKMCGGDLLIEAGMSVCECEYCGTRQTVPNADNEKKMAQFARAGKLLRDCEFDKAAGLFEAIVVDFPDEAEAYWGLVLCHYGIEYVDDPATGKKVPTCHRSSFDSVLDDENLDKALDFADSVAKKVYRAEAKAIEELRKGIIEVSGKEEPYDIFISYKETDDKGERTLDSVIAQDIYDALTEKGYRVFFSRITLEDKLGTEYEPYIFAALNSAKVMLVVGTDYDHFNAVWVKNEWSRFLKLIAGGQKKTLIPCYKNMDAYDMPKEFAKLTAQDIGKIGAMQDLLRGVGKLIPKETPKVEIVRETVVKSAGSTVDTLLERMFMFLEDGKWNDANSYAEKVLDAEPKNAEAYVGKLMAHLRVRARTALKDHAEPIAGYENYKKAVRFGSSALIAELEGYNTYIITRNKNAVYDAAQSMMDAANTEEAYKKAAKKYGEIPAWKDADAKAKECLELAEVARKNGIYDAAQAAMDAAKTEDTYKNAARKFGEIPAWRDADTKAAECLELAETARKDAIYDEACGLLQKDTTEALRQAVAQLSIVKDWKDSAAKIALCEQRIAELEAQAEADRVAAEQKAEAARITAEAKAKKTKKTITIAAVLAVLIAIAAAVVVKVVIPNNKYNEAVTLMEAEQYAEAIVVFESLDDYKDSAEKIIACKDGIIACNYENGLALMEAGEYSAAYEVFASIKDYEDSAEKLVLCSVEEIKNSKVGDRVIFGSYTNPIEWRVLDKTNDNVLLITEQVIIYNSYDVFKLYGRDYFDEFFSDLEKKYVSEVVYSEDNKYVYATDSGNAAKNKMFLLSVEEAQKYFKNDKERATSGINGLNIRFWWLRTPGNYSSRSAYVNMDGSINLEGETTNTYEYHGYSGLRPAIWIDLNA